MFDGLQRLIANGYQFTKSQRTRLNIAEAVADNCNFTEFMADTGIVTFGEKYQTSCTDLYDAYYLWCSMNAITANKRETFINWLKGNEERYQIKYVYHVPIEGGRHVRGFRGIKVNLTSRLKL